MLFLLKSENYANEKKLNFEKICVTLVKMDTTDFWVVIEWGTETATGGVL